MKEQMFEFVYEGFWLDVADFGGERTVTIVLPKKKGKQAKVKKFPTINEAKSFVDSWNKNNKKQGNDNENHRI